MELLTSVQKAAIGLPPSKPCWPQARKGRAQCPSQRMSLPIRICQGPPLSETSFIILVHSGLIKIETHTHTHTHTHTECVDLNWLEFLWVLFPPSLKWERTFICSLVHWANVDRASADSFWSYGRHCFYRDGQSESCVHSELRDVQSNCLDGPRTMPASSLDCAGLYRTMGVGLWRDTAKSWFVWHRAELKKLQRGCDIWAAFWTPRRTEFIDLGVAYRFFLANDALYMTGSVGSRYRGWAGTLVFFSRVLMLPLAKFL